MEKEQDVTVAKSAGFCPGVKRAIDKVLELEAAGKKPVYTIGPLIHNKQVTDMLAAKQITSIDRPQEAADKAGVLVIRAHYAFVSKGSGKLRDGSSGCDLPLS